MIIWHFGQVKVETASAYNPSQMMIGILTKTGRKETPDTDNPQAKL